MFTLYSLLYNRTASCTPGCITGCTIGCSVSSPLAKITAKISLSGCSYAIEVVINLIEIGHVGTCRVWAAGDVRLRQQQVGRCLVLASGWVVSGCHDDGRHRDMETALIGCNLPTTSGLLHGHLCEWILMKDVVYSYHALCLSDGLREV